MLLEELIEMIISESVWWFTVMFQTEQAACLMLLCFFCWYQNDVKQQCLGRISLQEPFIYSLNSLRKCWNIHLEKE